MGCQPEEKAEFVADMQVGLPGHAIDTAGATSFDGGATEPHRSQARGLLVLNRLGRFHGGRRWGYGGVLANRGVEVDLAAKQLMLKLLL